MKIRSVNYRKWRRTPSASQEGIHIERGTMRDVMRIHDVEDCHDIGVASNRHLNGQFSDFEPAQKPCRWQFKLGTNFS